MVLERFQQRIRHGHGGPKLHSQRRCDRPAARERTDRAKWSAQLQRVLRLKRRRKRAGIVRSVGPIHSARARGWRRHCRRDRSASANHGDGNRDGITDANQRDVASLRAKTDGSFVTLESPGHTLTNVRAIAAPNAAANLPLGLFAFEIHDVTPGGAATVNMILPEGFTTNSYLKQDSTGASSPLILTARPGRC